MWPIQAHEWPGADMCSGCIAEATQDMQTRISTFFLINLSLIKTV